MTGNYKKGWDAGSSGQPFDHSLEKDTHYMDGWLDGYNSSKKAKDALEKPSEELVEV